MAVLSGPAVARVTLVVMSSVRRRLRERSVSVFAGGISPTAATIGGVAAVVALGLVLGPIGSGLTRATEGLLLVLPVVVAAVLGSRRSAYVVAAAATGAFTLMIPPVGSVAVALLADAVGLVAFFVVAVVVSTLVAKRIEVLAQVEDQRRLLLRSVSHDLRTPLAAIRAAASELSDGGQIDEVTRARLLDLVSDEADRLDRLVANLLSLSRIEAGALQPNHQSVDVAELIGFCAKRLDRVFHAVVLEVRLAPDLPPIDADFTQLDQTLTNLLENAARHSPVDGTVVVEATADATDMTITVSDEGPGIDPGQLDVIFEPFRSGPIAGWSGIGLAICKAVVEAHGGTITAGDSPAGGARFTVTLPL